jgi:hypothetical protein
MSWVLLVFLHGSASILQARYLYVFICYDWWADVFCSGYVGWQGRIAFELYEDLKSYIYDLLDIILGRKKEQSEE